MIEKLKTIAVQHGLADIALELSSDEWQVRRVFHPGEKIISETKPAAPRPSIQLDAADRSSAHAMLDEIYDSANPEIVSAAQQNLFVLAKYAQLTRAKGSVSRRKV